MLKTDILCPICEDDDLEYDGEFYYCEVCGTCLSQDEVATLPPVTYGPFYDDEY